MKDTRHDVVLKKQIHEIMKES